MRENLPKILGCASYKTQSPQCILCFPLETNIFAYERGEKPICIMWNINAPTNDANFQHFKNVFSENNSEGFI